MSEEKSIPNLNDARAAKVVEKQIQEAISQQPKMPQFNILQALATLSTAQVSMQQDIKYLQGAVTHILGVIEGVTNGNKQETSGVQSRPSNDSAA